MITVRNVTEQLDEKNETIFQDGDGDRFMLASASSCVLMGVEGVEGGGFWVEVSSHDQLRRIADELYRIANEWEENGLT